MRLLYTIVLLGVTAVWGWTFVVVQDAISAYGVIPFLAARFLLAACALVPFTLRRITRGTLVAGAGVGLVLAVGYLFQTLGLLYTTPTNSGLITGMFVVFAPLSDRLLFGVRISRPVLAAVILSFAGMVLLAGGSPDGVNLGDLLTLLCAAALGLQIALLSRYASGHDALGFASVETSVMALLFTGVWLFSGGVSFPPRSVWMALIVTGLLASAAAFWAQTFVQQRLPAARAAVILTMEPVFAALFGYWLAGDRLDAVQMAGAALILSALFLGEILPLLTRRRAKKGLPPDPV
ncbi:DMT family transporter [Rubrobacter calidifluminis]|uniref:DMT family transporter n=1 Tax=Rubrobacter calidifluminis TaxID=1392640 RepID=UPI002362AE0B|nr:DMT family transporter [Rubrobacter calidifluminis]